MIRPPLPRVRDGDVLGLGLMNGIINKVEYAADLLRQGRPLPGNQISVFENYNGSLVSYSQEQFFSSSLFWAGPNPVGWGGGNGWEGTIEIDLSIIVPTLKKQFIRFENIKENFNGNFGLIYIGVFKNSFALQIWNANSAVDDGFNIYLNNNFLSQLFFDFDVPSGGFYKSSGWNYGIVPTSLFDPILPGLVNIDLNAQQSITKTIPINFFNT